jgi:ribosomal-protein-alanine N-acetyltransferase
VKKGALRVALVRVADAAELAALHREAFPAGWSADSLRGLLESAGVYALGAKRAGGPVGFILCRVAADEAEIITLAVCPGARRRGVGTALLAAARREAAARGATVLHLEVAADNIAAAALYRYGGFRETGRRPGYYPPAQGSTRTDAVLMARSTGAAAP